jgi:1-acyl-sn-glycerol-3-phosphate acyltransferase
MLTLPRMEQIRLIAKPRFQRVVAYALLGPNYAFAPGVDIRFENAERIPDRPVLYAMNHTDRYNFWPFQYTLWRRTGRFTATWVKGKYYQNAFTSWFLQATNNIPTVSRGYLIARDFVNVMQRSPNEAEYETLRRMVETVAESAATGEPRADVDASAVPREVFETPRDILGVAFDPAKTSYADAVDGLFRAMMRRFTALNAEALEMGLDVLIFPQGTRSVRLSKGHVGISQIALANRAPIVPVGSNGSHRIYPTNSPFAKRGTVTYRFGEPITYDDMRPFHVSEAFEPFTPEAEHRHRAAFQGHADFVMDRINDLLDPEHRYSDDRSSEGVKGTSRFV